MPKSTSQFPGPVSEAWDWQLRVRCRQLDTNLFFPREGEGRIARARRKRVAKTVCAPCPVLRTCRLHALQTREPFGVWGGTTEGDRNRISIDEPGPF
ncbi:WhiB family transcriptional regulator [Rhodococcus sp. OK302]|jgi:WhiB family transcriptional regulator, redox-sensing transcriptional regulator|uniref:WhiB family transcriptional regulator n=1 Tax=Rhodococcus sp. OK302 TaxID=1882769 RepID=UPI000B945F3C|nr:WhiB family transcriptional regulator [Rhodococcus sp. OK302]OYD61011.1 WhiB family redox-sensing transcriptional regulator [Rhodococcus sp. OK302]